MKKLLSIAFVLISLQAFCQGQFQKEAAGSIGFVSGQIMQLAGAIPADKYAYTPQTGVRSVAEVCAHIIGGNYLFASKLGGKVPDGLNVQTLEKDLKSKDAIAAELKRSFDIVIAAVKNTPDASLGNKVVFPFPESITQA
ncbi:MAG: DinB family protein [Cyclobacteriaceae bacterium]